MKRLTAKTRIVIGQVFLLVSVLLGAIALGFMPDSREAITRERARMCEALAISASTLVSQDKVQSVDDMISAIVMRHGDLRFVVFRDNNGKIIAHAGNVAATSESSSSVDSQMTVPVFSGDQKMGSVEFSFVPLERSGIFGWLYNRQLRMVIFVGTACFILFMLYLRKMLQHLDPSKVVPQRVRSALDTLVSGLFVIDMHDRIVLANEAFASSVGKTPEALVGCKVQNLPWVQEDNKPLTNPPWQQAIAAKSPQSNFTLQLRCGDKALRSFMVNSAPVMGHDGAVRGALVSLEDITELQRKEVELRESRDTADKANRAKSEFLARMSHEIRTPLNAVLGFADVLRRGYADSEEQQKEYLNTIHASGQHLLALINDILDLSKVEAGKLEIEHVRCSPGKLIRDVVRELSVRADEKGIVLTCESPTGVPAEITTDPVRLRQVLINLVGNAIKFTTEGGVRIVAAMIEAEGQPRLSVQITDTGIGMSSEVLARVFQPFVQGDNSIARKFGGTGLGLVISRRLAEAMGASLAVTSEVGTGTTFTVLIPLSSSDDVNIVSLNAVTPEDAESCPVPGPFLPSGRVLVADDGESNRKLVQVVLARAKVHVVSACDGAEAVRLASTQRFDVILMDMNMPVMDGFEATRVLRKNGCNIPIISMSADAMKGDEERCREAGCTGFLPKPIQIDQLCELVGNILAKNSETPAPSPAKAASRAIESPEAPLQSALPMDDADFREIVDEFIDKLQQQLGAIRQAWEADDLATLASLAHWLKGSGGTAGFSAFTKPAATLEKSAKAKELTQIESSIAEIASLVARVQRPASHGSIQQPSSVTALRSQERQHEK